MRSNPITTNLIVTRLARLEHNNSVAVFEVQTDDLGNNNQGGIHVYDQNGSSAQFRIGDPNVDATWRREGSDDLFQIRVPVSDLNGMDVDSLWATGFVDVNGYRLWEGLSGAADLQVTALQRDELRTVSNNAGPVEQHQTDFGAGTVSLGTRYQATPGHHDFHGELSLTEIAFTDTNNQFGGAPTIDALVMPVVRSTDPRDHVGAVIKNILDLRNEALVTLARGADGTYRAAAPANRAFTQVSEAQIYLGARAQTAGFEVAFNNPTTGQWVKNGDQNIFVNV